MIECKHLSHHYSYQPTPSLSDVTLSIKQGEFVYLMGKSGSGKSTLMKTLYGENAYTDGELIVNGFKVGELDRRQLSELRRTVGVVFQDFRLLPHLTVRENIAFTLESLDVEEDIIHQRVNFLLDTIGLAHKAYAFPEQLSGGEQQRVAIARAVANGPSLIVADEPTGNLDASSSIEIMELLHSLHAGGSTVVMATHDRSLVTHYPHRVVELEYGRVVRDEL